MSLTDVILAARPPTSIRYRRRFTLRYGATPLARCLRFMNELRCRRRDTQTFSRHIYTVCANRRRSECHEYWLSSVQAMPPIMRWRFACRLLFRGESIVRYVIWRHDDEGCLADNMSRARRRCHYMDIRAERAAAPPFAAPERRPPPLSGGVVSPALTPFAGTRRGHFIFLSLFSLFSYSFHFVIFSFLFLFILHYFFVIFSLFSIIFSFSFLFPFDIFFI